MQVKLLAFHPTQPWLVYADKGQTFSVIDWCTQQVGDSEGQNSASYKLW